MKTVAAVWQDAERRWPDKTALVTADERLGYSELATRIRRLSAALASEWQVRPREVVALLAPNSVEFIVSYFAITAMGAMIQPVDERLTVDEMHFALEDSGARCVIVHRALWHKFAEVRPKLPGLRRVLGIDLADAGIDRYDEWVNADASPEIRSLNVPAETDVAELMYTSGTTGRAKAVMRSHANVRAASGNALRAFAYRHEDVIAVVMPLSHSSALVSQMLPMFEVGGVVLPMDRFDAEGLMKSIRRESVSCLRAVPAIFRMLLAYREFNADHLPSLRLLMNSSAAIDPETYLDVKKRFPGVEMVNSYGLTEASTSSILTDDMAREHPDSIGVAIAGVQMRVVDDAGRDTADDQEGEIWIRGPHVFVGYRGMPEESASAIADGGWLRTGDIGRRDGQGLIYFHGRRDDVINCGGLKFAPLDVENCILELPEIAEVAVIGMPHRILGQVAKAFVVYREDMTPDPKAVSRHCAQRLPSHKIPFKVEVMTSLPRNSVGKVLHRKLHASSSAAA